MERRSFLRNTLGSLAAVCLRSRTALALTPTALTRRVLYVLGGFSGATPEFLHTMVDTIGPSAFNVLIFSFLQATYSGGQLRLAYNGNDWSVLAALVAPQLARLRTGFGLRRILLSIGGWQQLSTYAAIRSCGVEKFVQRLTEQVLMPFGFDGIDLDLEPQTGGLENWIAAHHLYGATLVELTNVYKRVHPSHLVTHAPLSQIAAQLYVQPAALPGVPEGLLHATRTRTGNNIDWLNVQLYEGGVISGSIAGFYRDALAAPLASKRQEFGISNPLHFLVPLFQPNAKQPLAFCRETLADINQNCANLHLGRVSGAALWEYGQIAATMPAWSQGLAAAV